MPHIFQDGRGNTVKDVVNLDNMKLINDMETVIDKLAKTKKKKEKDKIVEEHLVKLQRIVYDTAPAPLASGASDTGSEGDAESDVDYDTCMCGLADSKLYQGTTSMEDTMCRFCCDTPNIQNTFTPMDFRNETNIPYWMKEDFFARSMEVCLACDVSSNLF